MNQTLTWEGLAPWGLRAARKRLSGLLQCCTLNSVLETFKIRVFYVVICLKVERPVRDKAMAGCDWGLCLPLG